MTSKPPFEIDEIFQTFLANLMLGHTSLSQLEETKQQIHDYYTKEIKKAQLDSERQWLI